MNLGAEQKLLDPSSSPDSSEMAEPEVNEIITASMLEEERQLEKEGQEEERKLMQQAKMFWEKDSREMRYKRLQHLLEKSNIYSKFLLTKMEQQQLEEQQRKAKLEKKRKLLASTQVVKGDNQSVQETETAMKKRGREEETYNLSDYISKEDILSRVKKARTDENGDVTAPKKLEAADIEKSQDSNFAIKDRLAQTVRHNSQHLLDPVRKVNGQAVPYQQPKLFKGGVMRCYQVEGMEWLRMLWENGINGILADEMGLGKTVQCIAMIAMMVDRGVPGPFFVCGPLSTLPNWVSEFKRFTPEIPVLLYHGNQKDRLQSLRKIHKKQGSLHILPVVITSYEIAMRDRKHFQNCHWKYLIVDEGHRIKNLNCRLSQELKRFNTDNKLLLTGTPLQNNLAELWSLLNFLLPDVFDDLKSFESWFDITSITENVEDIVASEQEQNILHMLHQILTPFLLRRLKSDVTLEIPPKREVVVYAPLSKKQESFYTAIVNKTISTLLGQESKQEKPQLTPTGRPKRRSRKLVNYTEDYDDDDLEKMIGVVQQNAHEQRPVLDVYIPQDKEVHLKLQNVLMLLRKCCNHPYLIEYPLDPKTQEFKIDEELVKSSGKFLILDRMLPELQKRGHKVLIFSQMTSMLDILMDYCYLRDYKYSRLDGSMSYVMREENINNFNSDPEVFIFLLSTRAGGLGINLTAADTVIIYDSDWNPQADLQAQDRCHRIGQTKPVVVYRLVTANTIDEKIVEKATAKRRLEKMVIHKNKFKGGKSGLNQSRSCLDSTELMELLKSRDHEREVKGSTDQVISDGELQILMDRSDLSKQKKSGIKKQTDKVFKVLDNDDMSAGIQLCGL
ncbi:lymphoid-specific helicase isoform X1 [Hemiscyllium ocellatum]|uniref:lymphoid-specific helicase isoform X1 n=2 Tax=Hemiscyllium ocellatum TaxID=170820 RepID=UPI0029660ECC|nr:lymphoid-specific helicase isoform X1 [Hemiscyllium ocellatum]XP_060697821.1 lymphoid-specific helicase isoform X1 [Hemiscyllium ocellatum]